MEDGWSILSSGKAPVLVPVRLELNPFTLVGATTRSEGSSTSPLGDRFGVIMPAGVL